MQFPKLTRQATAKLTPKAAPRAIPMPDPKKPPQTAPDADEMVEFMVGEYINRAKLKALLDELFPGKWSAKNRQGPWKIKAPRKLTEAEYESLQDSTSAAAA